MHAKVEFVLKWNHMCIICSLLLVICDMMWDLQGLQKAGGSCRAHDYDCFRDNQLAVNYLNVSFWFPLLAMRQTLIFERALSSIQHLDGSCLGSRMLDILSHSHLFDCILTADLSTIEQRQQISADLRFLESVTKCL